MSQRFYINCPLQPGPATLEGPEAHHIAVVCRARPGDLVTLFNGDGHEYPARIIALTRRLVDVDVTGRDTPARELPFSLEIAAPVPKGDRGQFLIEKLTELGVTTFVPLLCQHSVIQPREGHVDKLRRHVIEASKQCGRNVLMEVNEPVRWAEYCQRPGNVDELRILAHPCRDKVQELGVWGRAGVCRMAVGPEAGFTEEEVAMGRTAGWHIVGLGPRILRIETAALLLAGWAIGKGM